DRVSYFEQNIFAFSPFGTLATSLLILAGFVGSFVLACAIDGHAAARIVRNGIVVGEDARAAVTLSLLIAVALGMQRYAFLKDRQDRAEHCSSLRQESAYLPGLRWRSTITASLVGITFGAVATFTFLPTASSAPRSLVFIWFLVTNSIVSALFARGIALTRAGNREFRRFIDEDLIIDLLRIEQLTFVGRSAGRTALIWFLISAVLCLFFVGNTPPLFALFLVLLSAGLGLAIFIVTMEHVHRRIRATKAAELEQVRRRITVARDATETSGDAALRLQALIAYEQRIASTAEWPFDQSTAVRVGASALILTVPWFGQAVAGTVVEHAGRMLH
ncbi:MAG: hypothetical protein JOZ55_01860, partial [Alphaproteobacteria bacterium]|nr:hypothetical protein [Alphaproteobacteria bacterium]